MVSENVERCFLMMFRPILSASKIFGGSLHSRRWLSDERSPSDIFGRHFIAVVPSSVVIFFHVSILDIRIRRGYLIAHRLTFFRAHLQLWLTDRICGVVIMQPEYPYFFLRDL
jgi:hypothetical protein